MDEPGSTTRHRTKRSRRRRRTLPLVKFLYWSGAVVSTLIAVWCASWLLVGDDAPFSRLGAYAEPWLGLIALLAGVPGAIARKPLASLQILLAILMLFPVAERYWPGRLWNKAAPPDLRVVSFNITDFDTATLGATYDRAAKEIAARHPDIIFLQQILNEQLLLGKLKQAMGGGPIYVFPNLTAQNVDLIVSRYPLEEARIPFDRSVSAIVRLPDCRLVLWDLHGPHGERDATAQEEFFAAFRAQFGAKSRAVVAGDLNSTEFNSAQAPLREVLTDAFAKSGYGAGFTYPTSVRRLGLFGPLVRIDHIFSSADLVPVQSVVFGGTVGSDHFALFAALRLPPNCALAAHSSGRP